MAANYLLTALAFAVLARASVAGGLVAAIAGGVVPSLVITSVWAGCGDNADKAMSASAPSINNAARTTLEQV